jgi:hypothetical protein
MSSDSFLDLLNVLALELVIPGLFILLLKARKVLIGENEGGPLNKIGYTFQPARPLRPPPLN